MRFGSQDPTVVLSCGTPRYYKTVLYPKGTQLAEAVSFLQAHKATSRWSRSTSARTTSPTSTRRAAL